jgi:hypothetical protein
MDCSGFEPLPEYRGRQGRHPTPEEASAFRQHTFDGGGGPVDVAQETGTFRDDARARERIIRIHVNSDGIQSSFRRLPFPFRSRCRAHNEACGSRSHDALEELPPRIPH